MKYLKHTPETNNDLAEGIIVVSAYFAAASERIYNSLTNPREFEIWWGSGDTYRMTQWSQDLRINGTYTVDVLNHTGNVAPASGRFIEINAPGKFVYTRRYDWDFPGLGRRKTTISYIIDGNERGTRLRVIHEGFKGQEEAALQHSAGWIRVLHWLGDYLEAKDMKDYHTSIETDRSATQVFEAVNNVAGWWASTTEGKPKLLGDIFTVHFGSTWATFRVTESIAGRRIIWSVIDCHMDLLKDKKEWKGTQLIWNILSQEAGSILQMTHLGLIPFKECYVDCTGGWDFYVGKSLNDLLNQKPGQPGTGIMATVRCGDRNYKGVLYSRGQELPAFPENYLIIDVKENDVESVSEAYSVTLLNPKRFSQLRGKYYMILENKCISEGIQPIDDLQSLMNAPLVR